MTTEIATAIGIGAILGAVFCIVVWPAVLLIHVLLSNLIGNKNALLTKAVPAALLAWSLYYFQLGSGSVAHRFSTLYVLPTSSKLLDGGYERGIIEPSCSYVFVTRISSYDLGTWLKQNSFQQQGMNARTRQDDAMLSYANFLLRRLTFSTIRISASCEHYKRSSNKGEERIFFDPQSETAVFLLIERNHF